MDDLMIASDDNAMNLWTPDAAILDANYVPEVDYQNPVNVFPLGTQDGYTMYGEDSGSLMIGQGLTTNANFYPPSPTPNATGKNVVSIGNDKYVVTLDNYTAIARLYITYQQNQYGKVYTDQETISLILAMKQLAGQAGIGYTIDPETGAAIPDTKTSDAVLNNPVVKVADAISGTGTELFNAGASVVQGVAQGTKDLAGLAGGVGSILQGSGGIFLLLGAAAVIFYYVKVKK